MYVVSVDFSLNSLLAEQIGIKSLYELDVLNRTLCEHNLSNFANSDFERFALSECEIDKGKSFDFTVINEADFVKKVYSLSDNECILLYKNSVYFECDIYDFFDKNVIRNIALTDENSEVFALICRVASFKKIHSQASGFKEIFNLYKRYDFALVKCVGYAKNLSNIKAYKHLICDILSNKTLYTPPLVAEGVFTSGSIPKGDFSIVPPVYFGDGVQVENGAEIGPFSVVCSNVLISKKTVVKNTILCEDCFVSANCYIDGAVCCKNASIKRNSAIFNGAIVGENAIIAENTIVENGSIIYKNTRFDSNISSDTIQGFISFLNNLTPHKASRLGSAISTFFNKPRVLVACDGATSSTSIKLALISGLSYSGAECFDAGVCFLSRIFYSAEFCECDFSVFVGTKNNKSYVDIYNSDNEPISKTDYCNLVNLCKPTDTATISAGCKSIRQVNGLCRMYVRQLEALFEGELVIPQAINCTNKVILNAINSVLEKATNTVKSNKITVYLNENGTAVNIQYKSHCYNSKDLKKLVYFFVKNHKISKLGICEDYKNLWQCDAVFLTLSVLHILKTQQKSIDELMNSLPCFCVKKETVTLNKMAGDTALRLSKIGSVKCKNNCFDLTLKNAKIKIKKSLTTNQAKIFCFSNSFACSDELCGALSDIIADPNT